MIEYSDGQIERRAGGASMAGSLRIDGGMNRLIQCLLSRIDSDALVVNSRVRSIKQVDDELLVQALNPNGLFEQRVKQVVLALPPRVLDGTIRFEPSLPSQQQSLLSTVPTWMAAHAKFVAVYSSPFWKTQSLSGDAMSQIGPCVEIHDASPRVGDEAALFGFIGIPANQRAGRHEQLKQLGIEQLVRLFGPEARQPLSTCIKDWAADDLTATELDLLPPTGVRKLPPHQEWQQQIIWAGTETANTSGHSNGYLEGAVESGFRAADTIVRKLK